MKRYLHQFVVFLCLLIVSLFAYWSTSSNAYIPNAYIHSKLEVVKKGNYNTVFIGSSKINNQIDPFIIDSIVGGKQKSYNLGANGSFDLENFSTIEYILENQFNIDTIVLELQDKVKFTSTNLKSDRVFKNLTPKNFWYCLHYFSNAKDYKQLGYTFFILLENVFHPNRDVGGYDNKSMMKFIDNNGFIPLDEDKNKSVIKRHEKLLKNPLIIHQRLKEYNNDHQNHPNNKALVNKLKDLQKKCSKNRIDLILLIPAPAEPDAKRLLSYQNIGVPSINMIDPDINPEFYQLENRWDYGHLNYKGAKLHSKKVAYQLRSVLYDKN